MRDDLSRLCTLEQQLTSSFEMPKGQVLSTPLRNDLLQLGLNIFLFVCRYTDILQYVMHQPIVIIIILYARITLHWFLTAR